MGDIKPSTSRAFKNVVLFGETGVGKSSIINLIAGKNVADTSPNLEGCTLDATEYHLALSEEVSLRIFDTVGLEEPEIGVNTFMGAIAKAHQLITSLHSRGGIDLLLFCIRGGRLTSATQRSYRLFFEILCGSHVPLAIVVTNLEQEQVMEHWWVKNEKTFERYGIHSVAHACITAVPPHITAHARKRRESRDTLRRMLLEVLSRPSPAHTRDTQSWFIAVLCKLRLLVPKKRALRHRDLLHTLETRCLFSHDDALKLVRMLSGKPPQQGEAAMVDLRK